MCIYLDFLVEPCANRGTHLLDGVQGHGAQREASVELVLHDVNLLAQQVCREAQTKDIGTLIEHGMNQRLTQYISSIQIETTDQ